MLTVQKKKPSEIGGVNQPLTIDITIAISNTFNITLPVQLLDFIKINTLNSFMYTPTQTITESKCVPYIYVHLYMNIYSFSVTHIHTHTHMHFPLHKRNFAVYIALYFTFFSRYSLEIFLYQHMQIYSYFSKGNYGWIYHDLF